MHTHTHVFHQTVSSFTRSFFYSTETATPGDPLVSDPSGRTETFAHLLGEGGSAGRERWFNFGRTGFGYTSDSQKESSVQGRGLGLVSIVHHFSPR